MAEPSTPVATASITTPTPMTPTEPADLAVDMVERVRSLSYYHGLLGRHDVEPLLKAEGDFLLRKSEVKGQIVITLAVRAAKGIKHFLLNQNEQNQFYFESHFEPTINELIEWHVKNQAPVSQQSGVKLKSAVERPPWLLNHDSVRMSKKLGEGAFGEVYMAVYTSDGVPQKVAIKTIRGEVSREERLKFMKEARLMRKLSNKYIVKILGVAVHEHPLMIVMELCLGGSMLGYLRKHKGQDILSTKLRFCYESAVGLAYLEKQGFIHRDIAARNCLLSEKNEVKISDFGMSDERKLLQDDKLDKVPVKWLAPETMQNKIYSNKTDVWSYGIMAWEIYADGAEPYPGLTNIQTRAKIIVQNYRMTMPTGTPAGVIKLVEKCWLLQPNDRPSFESIVKTLEPLLT
ncbi:unnamed protein product [Bursaphelenchus xylophilus]|uniref:Tyrosine-protein kinase n=1 Tax=Bursaphelenchus xylophilus TaxID=6326 RepID=A0A1I7S9P3_BURXY|nr:unnamed protein product [Bursaphelenchus xylophilus]CAG9131913.1 unnamed protein product [Bursaphelenchus xylophilus]